MTDMELVARLAKLERDNQRLKRFGVASFVLMALLVGYVASRSRHEVMNGKITAREIDVTDSSGKVRIKMDVQCIPSTNCWPAIGLFDEDGKERTGIGAGTLNISGDRGGVELLEDVLQFNGGSKGAVPGVTVRLGSGGTGGGSLWLVGKDSNSVFFNSDPPSIEIQDSKGFATDLGAANLATQRTGETSQTSAASIVMFGNDKGNHVIWRAP
jgi:hypothetical protein